MRFLQETDDTSPAKHGLAIRIRLIAWKAKVLALTQKCVIIRDVQLLVSYCDSGSGSCFNPILWLRWFGFRSQDSAISRDERC